MIYPEGVREELDRICLQDPDKLSPEDLGFLRARRDYLDAPEKEKFASVLTPKIAESGEVADEAHQVGEVEPEAPKKKVVRKKA